MIDGVLANPLKIIEDERGAVLHMLRADSPMFSSFGEVYFSEVNPGAIKGWKRHRLMTQHFAVPVGRIKVVVCDKRESSPTRGSISEFILGRPDSYQLLIIPPLLWYAFQGLSQSPSILANCADLPHALTESEQADVGFIQYEW